MIDKGPDSTNPLALIGSAVLGSFGTWVASLLFRKKHDPGDEDRDIDCATKGELRALRSEFKGDVAYVVERLDRIEGSISRIIRGETAHGD